MFDLLSSALLGLSALPGVSPLVSGGVPVQPSLEAIAPSPHTYEFSLVSALPFVVLLLAIAVLPLATPRFWHMNRNRAIVAGLLAAPIAALLLAVAPASLLHTLLEYASFVVILVALYTISGGIVLRGDLEATPRVNAAFLAFGAVIANAVGTTGASMLLVRPLLRTNRERKRVAHIPLFFILIVSNAGGMLTPLGDPPLFLGYLRGVPFFWTARLFPIWILSNVWLLACFLAVDTWQYRREGAKALRADRTQIEPLRLRGRGNIALLAVVAASAFLPSPFREIIMVAAAVVSYVATPDGHHKHNGFTFAPMNEVAILFAGIFVTMVPALEILGRHAPSLGIERPWQFFWLTGGLSSVLDNAPTYLTFLSIAEGLDLGGPILGIPHRILEAISAGAVLMGANSYIGNGPNFMVKAIAEHRGIKMPSFFGFMLLSFAVLLPLYVAITLIFFRE